MKGVVYKSTGKHYQVKGEDDKFYLCQLKGKFRIDKEIKSSNPIAVGDEVIIDINPSADDVDTISDILPRKNYIIRVSPQNRNQKHILASNIDQVMIVASIQQPRTSLGFIDRLLVTAEAYHITPLIVINKIDLLQDDASMDEYLNIKQIYESIGYRTLGISAIDKHSMSRLYQELDHQSTLIMGHSGVGKSTIINELLGNKERKTKEISDWSGKGQHTTTFAEMLDLPTTGQVIDTPGIKEFGIIDFEREELAQYFPEFRSLMSDCKYHNCTHISEPRCAVKDAVEEGSIAMERYESYLAIYDSIPRDNY